jgi:acetyl-CoA acetyltransferase
VTDVYVAGVGMTPFGKLPDRSVKDLTRAAVDNALADAGLSKDRVAVVFFANATQSSLEGQHMIAGQLALRSAGFERIPVTNVENACASGATAFHLAYSQVKAGLADVALAVGSEGIGESIRPRTLKGLPARRNPVLEPV